MQISIIPCVLEYRSIAFGGSRKRLTARCRRKPIAFLQDHRDAEDHKRHLDRAVLIHPLIMWADDPDQKGAVLREDGRSCSTKLETVRLGIVHRSATRKKERFTKP